MNSVEVREGRSPLILAIPHSGTTVPPALWERLNGNGQALTDTDWHVHQLYEGLLPGATIVRATTHRYVIDANRPPSGQSLYPGGNTTGLCPLTDFDGQPIWREGQEPSDDEAAERLETVHAPYHAVLAGQIDRIRSIYGTAILYDCHSIRSRIPYLFEGRLPDFNIGTNGGLSCAAAVQEAVQAACAQAKSYSVVINGRFRGGWTTRHYGRPDHGVHAVQMELAQASYMKEAPPWCWNHRRAERLRPHLRAVLRALEGLAMEGEL